jgi:hypothetical protein
MPDSNFLHRALFADAAVSGAAGLLMAAGAGPLQELLHVPAQLLFVAGMILIPYALGLVLLTRRTPLSAPLVWAVIATNVAWALGSVLILLTGHVQPNALGYGIILVQAIAVAAFAEIQYVGLRKATAGAA